MVTSHGLSDEKFKIMLQLTYDPEGAVEKVGDALAASLKNSLRRVDQKLVGGAGRSKASRYGSPESGHLQNSRHGAIHFHDLRDCAVTSLADAGVDIETIMKIVGHSSAEMFLRSRRRSWMMR